MLGPLRQRRYPLEIVTTSRRVLLTLLALLALLVPALAQAADLTVHVLDVGQGDSILIVSPVGKTVLVDAGPPDSARHLAARVRELVGGSQLDLLLMTHPHADHIGGMEAVLEAVGARIFMEPGFDHASPLYSRLLRTLESKGVALKVGEAGRNVDLGGGASLRLLAPAKPFFKRTRSDANANSIVMRLTYRNTAFYLSADSEAETERRILQSGEELRADVYKVAHHGSRHSNTRELLEQVRPKIAVVSVGAGNDYGHPTRQALDRLEAARAEVLRTDLDGEIILKSDGERVIYATEKGGGFAVTTPPVVEERPAPVPVVRETPRRDPPRPREPKTQVKDEPRPKEVEVAVTQPTPPPTRPAAKTIDLEPRPAPTPASSDGYVGSRNSQVFHRAGCDNALRIKPENLIRYKTREEAVGDGRRPGKDCNP